MWAWLWLAGANQHNEALKISKRLPHFPIFHSGHWFLFNQNTTIQQVTNFGSMILKSDPLQSTFSEWTDLQDHMVCMYVCMCVHACVHVWSPLYETYQFHSRVLLSPSLHTPFVSLQHLDLVTYLKIYSSAFLLCISVSILFLDGPSLTLLAEEKRRQSPVKQGSDRNH